jgi:hypothetical protein
MSRAVASGQTKKGEGFPVTLLFTKSLEAENSYAAGLTINFSLFFLQSVG